MAKTNLPVDIRQLKSEIESLRNFVNNKMELDFSPKFGLREKFKLLKKFKNKSDEVHWTIFIKSILFGGALINFISAIFNMSFASMSLAAAGFFLAFITSKLIDMSRFEANKDVIVSEEKQVIASKLEISNEDVISLSLHLTEDEKEKFVKKVEKTGSATIEDINIILADKVKLYEKVAPGEEVRIKAEEFRSAMYKTSSM